jgi:hypothetical protein
MEAGPIDAHGNETLRTGSRWRAILGARFDRENQFDVNDAGCVTNVAARGAAEGQIPEHRRLPT